MDARPVKEGPVKEGQRRKGQVGMMALMGIYGIWELMVLAFVAVVFIYPISRILKRIGWNPWLSFLWLIPVVNVVMLWVVAFAPWPDHDAGLLSHRRA